VVRDVAKSIGLSPRRFLIPLSYVSVMGGVCTLIGTSTNLLVNDMARNAGQPAFRVFDITPVALIVAVVGGLYLMVAAPRLLGGKAGAEEGTLAEAVEDAGHTQGGYVADPALFVERRPLDLVRSAASLAVFVAVIFVAAMGWAPIAASSFAGAVILVLTRVIGVDDAYRGLRPQILLLIAGMVVVGMSLEVTGLAAAATEAVIGPVQAVGPFAALVLFYGATLILTEILSNAAVAVLLTPVAVALAESLGVSTQPFLIALMVAASAAFATPFGYQTNVLVYEMGRYSYLDFLKIGLPLNVITWIAASLSIPYFFPF
jgi:di/tricarboxylate transporter